MPEDPKTPAPPSEPTPEQIEDKFWEKFEGHLDTWFDRKVEKYRTTSSSRTGRTTLPTIMADLIFGPPKEK